MLRSRRLRLRACSRGQRSPAPPRQALSPASPTALARQLDLRARTPALSAPPNRDRRIFWFAAKALGPCGPIPPFCVLARRPSYRALGERAATRLSLGQ